MTERIEAPDTSPSTENTDVYHILKTSQTTKSINESNAACSNCKQCNEVLDINEKVDVLHKDAILYHGTCKCFAQSIVKDGFKKEISDNNVMNAGDGREKSIGVFFTREYRQARNYSDASSRRRDATDGKYYYVKCKLNECIVFKEFKGDYHKDFVLKGGSRVPTYGNNCKNSDYREYFIPYNDKGKLSKKLTLSFYCESPWEGLDNSIDNQQQQKDNHQELDE